MLKKEKCGVNMRGFFGGFRLPDKNDCNYMDKADIGLAAPEKKKKMCAFMVLNTESCL